MVEEIKDGEELAIGYFLVSQAKNMHQQDKDKSNICNYCIETPVVEGRVYGKHAQLYDIVTCNPEPVHDLASFGQFPHGSCSPFDSEERDDCLEHKVYLNEYGSTKYATRRATPLAITRSLYCPKVALEFSFKLIYVAI